MVKSIRVIDGPSKMQTMMAWRVKERRGGRVKKDVCKLPEFKVLGFLREKKGFENLIDYLKTNRKEVNNAIKIMGIDGVFS
jgi:hypothetical protein